MGTSENTDCQWASKNSYNNSIRVGYERVGYLREGISGDELEGNFWEDGLPPCIQSQLECLHGWSVHNGLWQLVPVRDHSNAEHMLTATAFTPLLVNLESMTSKVNAGEAAKTASHGKSRRPCSIFYRQMRSPRLLLRTKGKSRSRWRAVSYGAWSILYVDTYLTFSDPLIQARVYAWNPGVNAYQPTKDPPTYVNPRAHYCLYTVWNKELLTLFLQMMTNC